MAWSAAGDGSPPVVLEAGMSGSSAVWDAVAEQVSRSTRIIAYDRAGYGGSDPIQPTPQQISHDLLAVLDDAAARGPVVLVGHSWGGLLARRFADAHPDRVAAMVLLDATHEALPGTRSPALQLANLAVAAAQRRRARSGRLRRDLQTGRGRLAGLVQHVPPHHQAALVEHLSAVRTWQQTAREVRALGGVLVDLPSAPPDVLVLALVGGGTPGERDTRARARVRVVYEDWLGAERVRVVPGAGHMLPLEAPDAVATAVVEVVQRVRSST